MDMGFLNDFVVIPILALCLCVGYILKKWIKDVDNKYIPTILCVLGVILSIASNGKFNLDVVLMGAVSGLSSTGLHQVFKGFIENPLK